MSIFIPNISCFHQDQMLISTDKIFRSHTLTDLMLSQKLIPGLAVTAISVQKITSLQWSVFEFGGLAEATRWENYGPLQGPFSLLP